MNILLCPVKDVLAIGSATIERLDKLGIISIQDLLFHLPVRYCDKTRLMPIKDLRQGEQVLVEGQVLSCRLIQRYRRQLIVEIGDGYATLLLRFFHFHDNLARYFSHGVKVRCFGEVRRHKGNFEMVHPEYQVTRYQFPQLEGTLSPIYSITKGISQTYLAKLVASALDLTLKQKVFSELLPDFVLKKFDLIDIVSALRTIHFPPPDVSLTQLEQRIHPAQKRLIIEELLARQLGLKLHKQSLQQANAPLLSCCHETIHRFWAKLPFQLTNAQKKVINEISQDLNRRVPMTRLVQGDVGSGKTVVAACAILQTVHNGFQVAFMAPTEILAEQHSINLKNWFDEESTQVLCLTSRLKSKTKKTYLEAIAKGHCQVVVGTHALFQEQVDFHRLGLAIIDEQHRFGVEQRIELQKKAKGFVPHQLVMSATPIPRTLAQAFYADFDLSVIDELPKGRQAIETLVVSNKRRSEVINKIGGLCQKGNQAYWVCPLIDKSDVMPYQAAVDVYELLEKSLPGCQIKLIHGRLASEEKESIIQAFKMGQCDILVATTVVEVGIDVPNAVLMVIENAEKLGLSQIHQLRGRVGRGLKAGYCLLMYEPGISHKALERLKVIKAHRDGFKIAWQDLKLRGAGDFFGTRQTGLSQLKVADIIKDHAYLSDMAGLADRMLSETPRQVEPLVNRWVSHRKAYIHV